MGGHKIINQNELHFLTFTVVGWIDVFIREKYCQIIIDSFDYCIKNKGLQLYAFVIMSSHIHLIVKTDNLNGLSSIIRDLKTFTSKKILQSIFDSRTESRRK